MMLSKKVKYIMLLMVLGTYIVYKRQRANEVEVVMAIDISMLHELPVFFIDLKQVDKFTMYKAYTRTHTHTHIYAHTHPHTHARTYAPTHPHTHTHTHTLTLTHRHATQTHTITTYTSSYLWRHSL